MQTPHNFFYCSIMAFEKWFHYRFSLSQCTIELLIWSQKSLLSDERELAAGWYWREWKIVFFLPLKCSHRANARKNGEKFSNILFSALFHNFTCYHLLFTILHYFNNIFNQLSTVIALENHLFYRFFFNTRAVSVNNFCYNFVAIKRVSLLCNFFFTIKAFKLLKINFLYFLNLVLYWLIVLF